ncbi:MAG: ATP-binding protein [Christensenellales bacterium]
MKIREIYVKSFGCLSDFKKEFHDGFNAVTENNGFGKTTLATFVKAMFYSLGYSRSSALEENELKRFRPWNSTEKFGGSVTFEHDGKLYRIERTFGATQKDETAFLVDFEKNKKTDVSKSDLGKRLFGIDAAAFERCLYLPQKQIEIKSNDSFVEKLSNLLDNAEDNNNFSAATARLREFSKKLRLERGSGGLLFETEQKKRQLEAQLCRQQEAQRKLDENRRQTLDALRAAEKGSARLKALDAQLKSLEKQRQNAQAADSNKLFFNGSPSWNRSWTRSKQSSPSLKLRKKALQKFTLCACAGALVSPRCPCCSLSQSGGGGRHFRRAARGRRGSLFFCEKKTTENAGRKFQNAKPSAGSRKADGRRTA